LHQKHEYIVSTKDLNISIEMEENLTELAGVTVTASPFRRDLESPVSLRIIGLQEIEKSPGANRDISRIVQSYPGVAFSPIGYRNDLIVRGGSPSENRFYLDGVEIPNINHFSTQGASDEYLQAIKDAGFDILLTANNHCLDRGKKGMERTIQLLDSSGIRYAGTYKNLSERRQRYPLFINRNGFRIALLNYTYGTNGIKATSPNIVNYIDKNTILQDIQSAKARQPDAIIACMHWGEEYQSLPNREQRELANWLLQQGVTHIIGSHPHVIQPMELRTNGTEQHIIVYSLGNFISNMSKANTDGGLIFTLQLEKHPLPQPIRPSYTGQSQTPLPDSNPLPFPYCRVSYCGYNLVWTGSACSCAACARCSRLLLRCSSVGLMPERG
jgi:hypothetical protein